jgi:hypothetical protein
LGLKQPDFAGIARLTEIICFPLSPAKGRLITGTRIWRIAADGPPGRSGYVPICVPEGQLVSSGRVEGWRQRAEALRDAMAFKLHEPEPSLLHLGRLLLEQHHVRQRKGLFSSPWRVAVAMLLMHTLGATARRMDSAWHPTHG